MQPPSACRPLLPQAGGGTSGSVPTQLPRAPSGAALQVSAKQAGWASADRSFHSPLLISPRFSYLCRPARCQQCLLPRAARPAQAAALLPGCQPSLLSPLLLGGPLQAASTAAAAAAQQWRGAASSRQHL